MRWLSAFCVAGLYAVAGCATRVDHIGAYGPVWLVSHDDVRAVIAARSCSDFRDRQIAYIEVISRDEMHVYFFYGVSMYDEVKRVRGRWQCTAMVATE